MISILEEFKIDDNHFSIYQVVIISLYCNQSFKQ